MMCGPSPQMWSHRTSWHCLLLGQWTTGRNLSGRLISRDESQDFAATSQSAIRALAYAIREPLDRRQPKDMKTRAYILIETSVGSTSQVADALRKIDDMIAVDMVTGPFDIIAVVEADSLVDIGGIVSTKMHQVGGIVKTITSLAVSAD